MATKPPGDYHMHTSYSDGCGDFDDFVEAALRVGLSEIGFSDHIVPAGYDQAGYGTDHERLGEYLARGRAAAAAAAARDLRVLVGVEVDYTPDGAAEMADLLAAHDFDHAIFSVHFAGRFGYDETRHRDDDRWRDPEALFGEVYGLLAEGAAWAGGRCAVVGHFDLPKKFGTRPTGAAAAEDAALAAIAAAGLAIEINTSGWRKPAAEAYPSLSILRRARGLGIPLTFGSDAHRPDDVGHRFADAVDLAREAGYDSTLRLSEGDEVPLP